MIGLKPIIFRLFSEPSLFPQPIWGTLILKIDYLQENQETESKKAAPISNVSSVVKPDDGDSGQDSKHDNDEETQSTNEQRAEPGISSYPILQKTANTKSKPKMLKKKR